MIISGQLRYAISVPLEMNSLLSFPTTPEKADDNEQSFCSYRCQSFFISVDAVISVLAAGLLDLELDVEI